MLEVFTWFEMKRDDIDRSSSKTSTQRASNESKELGTMSKNNIGRITFSIVPIWRIRSLTNLLIGNYKLIINLVKDLFCKSDL